MSGRFPARGVSGTGRPAVIAHAAGNAPATLRLALAGEVDFIEVDLWVHRGQLEARHERRLPFALPILFDSWYLKLATRKAFGLSDLLREVSGRCGVFLDLKNGGEEAARLVRQALDAARLPVRLSASSQSWGTLRELRRLCPEVAIFFSVDVRSKLELLRSVIGHDRSADGLSCRHTLLSRSLVAELRGQGLQVVAWTVDDPERAVELARWGVDGIATGAPAAIRAALEVAP
ncbi:MAG: hypothetical protein Kow0010_25860 [Dehalococcoidia bacterium]